MTAIKQKPMPPFDLLSIASIVFCARRRIFVWAGAGAIIGLILALVLRPYFISTAILLPPQQQSSIASVLSSQLPQLAASSGALSMGLKNPGDMYVGIMEGQTVSNWVIDRLHLDSVFHQKLRSGTIAALQHAMTFESSKDGLIRITAKAHSAQLAADIANAYVDALYHMNSTLAITEASQRRLFFEQQVEDEKKQLNQAEDNFRLIQQKTGMVQLAGQTELLLREIEMVRSQITSHEVQLSALSAYATPENAGVRQTQEELNALQSRLAQLESKQNMASAGKDSEAGSVGNVSTVGLEYLRKYRDMQYHESLFALLSKQYEAARLDEAKSAPVLQVVDHGTPADRKAGPSRILTVLLSMIGATVLGALFYVVRAFTPGAIQILQVGHEGLD